MRIIIGHLYPGLMNLYGDRGNVTALRQRCAWRSIKPVVTDINPGDRPWWSSFDILFVGGGQDREQRLMVADMADDLRAGLREAVGEGLAVFGVCGGYQLLGHYYRMGSGETLTGLGLIDAWTDSGPRRMVGDVLADAHGQDLVGFENHAGRTFLGPDARPLATIRAGFGNNGQDGTEGAVTGSVFGTYLHGPVLPKNPWLADRLIGLALKRRYGHDDLLPLDDRWELAAADTARQRAEQRRTGRT